MSDRPKNMERLAQGGDHPFDVTFLDAPQEDGGDAVNPDSFVAGTSDPDDFVTVAMKIFNSSTGVYSTPPAGYDAPTLGEVQYGGTPGLFTVVVTAQSSTKKSTDLGANEFWAIVWTTTINLNSEEHPELFTVVGSSGALFGEDALYGDSDHVKKIAGVTFSDIGLADEDALDDCIDALNRRASSLVETFTGRDFKGHVGDVARLEGNNRNKIALPGYPVITISSVTQDDTVLDADEYRVRDTPGRTGRNGGILEKRGTPWKLPGHNEWENVVVRYTWGYGSPPKSIAHIVESVTIRLLQKAKKSEQVGTAVQSLSMDGYSVSFSDQELLQELSVEEMEILKGFKRVSTA